MNADNNFVTVINEQYPYERYIVKNPQPISFLFDDALLTEIFIPHTEIKPILDRNGNLFKYTEVNPDEIYIKIKGNAGEMRFAYFDFNDHIRETIRDIIIMDMGEYEWESLYVDHEDGDEELKEMLNKQKTLITEKYGDCQTKKHLK